VAVLIETSRGYGRGLIRGVAQYCREHRHWSVFFKPQGLGELPPPWLKHWNGDGILARVADRKAAKAVLDTGLPTVDLRGAFPDLGLPHVGGNNRMLAQLAVNHLRQRGLRQFAFCGLRRGENASNDKRCDQFVRAVEASGFSCAVSQAISLLRRPETWEEAQGKLANWIHSLPKPVGIMACNDDCGLEVLNACQVAGVRVPHEAAVISVDNDEYVCTLSMPPLTSIDIASERIGYAAAGLLDRMMAGKTPRKQSLEIPPGQVIARQSTDMLATEDSLVLEAIAFIRDHLGGRITLADVVQHLGTSRATLETRLKSVTGQTVHREIQRIRIEMVKDLLCSSDLPLKQIAHRCGFKYTQHLARVFRTVTGETPIEFRKKNVVI
jgi:LacI family transcriptional regulator